MTNKKNLANNIEADGKYTTPAGVPFITNSKITEGQKDCVLVSRYEIDRFMHEVFNGVLVGFTHADGINFRIYRVYGPEKYMLIREGETGLDFGLCYVPNALTDGVLYGIKK